MLLLSLSIPSILTFLAFIQLSYSQCIIDVKDQNSLTAMKLSSSDKTKLYTGEQAFTISLLKAVNKARPNENIFFSPFSTYHALLLAYFGSANNTEKELVDALQLDWADKKAQVYQAYKLAKRNHGYIDGDIEFKSVDKIFLGNNVQFRDCIKNILNEELENMNFQENPEQSRKNINQWVEEVTNNEIKEFLKQGDISSQTNMVLANAAYFKGQWMSQFNKSNTKMEPFHIESNEMRLVEMMNHKGTYYFGTSEDLGCYLLEMRYKGEMGNYVSMIILLPPLSNGGKDNLNNVLEKLNPQSLKVAMNEFDSREVNVGLPKFTFEQRLELVPILNQLGIKDLFTGEANLKTFSDEANFGLGDAMHVAKIKVDEEGSTAAAATALFSFRSARPLEITNFKCNHPFIFLIFDHKTNAILFSGIYRNPDK